MYLAPSCTLWLLLGSALFEFRQMSATGALAFILKKPMDFIMTAFLGFFVNWMNYVVIKMASALTLKVGAAAMMGRSGMHSAARTAALQHLPAMLVRSGVQSAACSAA
jgi:hypothetical protein